MQASHDHLPAPLSSLANNGAIRDHIVPLGEPAKWCIFQGGAGQMSIAAWRQNLSVGWLIAAAVSGMAMRRSRLQSGEVCDVIKARGRQQPVQTTATEYLLILRR